MLQTQGLQVCNPAPTPHIDGHDKSVMQADEHMINLKTYQSILGSCWFLADTTHPEIVFTTGIAGQHSHRPTARHMQAIKRNSHLAGATNSGLYCCDLALLIWLTVLFGLFSDYVTLLIFRFW
jgi:hypothetical protein